MSGNSIEKLLDKIDTDLSNFLIFAGVLDNNAKLLSFRRGKASFSLPIERHETLDVQISLMFSLIRQLEDITGMHKFTVTRFARQDIFLFGTSDLHVFVITPPTSEEQVAKTLAELVTMITNSPELAPNKTATFAGRAKDASNNNMAAAMTSMHHDEPVIDRQKFSMPKSRPEAIAMLQGYLMAVDASCTVEDDVGSGYYKMKATGSDNKFAWSTLEKVSQAFKDKIELHQVGIDVDGKVFVKISLK
jgi:hypothetical protein